MVLLVVPSGHGSGYDQGGTRIIDQHAVHLIDHGIVMFALHHFIGGVHHVITQVIETEFVIGAIGDIGVVGFATGFAVGFVFVDAIYRQTQPFEDRPVPLGVTACQVIVHGHDMYSLAGQCIQVGRKCRYQGLTFTGGHLRDLSLVEHGTADQLHVIVYHVPGDHAAGGHPTVLIDGFIV